jgi:hypothetical protein
VHRGVNTRLGQVQRPLRGGGPAPLAHPPLRRGQVRGVRDEEARRRGVVCPGPFRLRGQRRGLEAVRGRRLDEGREGAGLDREGAEEVRPEKAGTFKFETYATLQCVEEGRRAQIACSHVGPLDDNADVIAGILEPGELARTTGIANEARRMMKMTRRALFL